METQIIKRTNGNLKMGNPAWKKGVSGNPKGRKPKADCLISCIKEELAKKEANSSLTREQMIASALIDKAVAGDLMAIRLALEYTVGKPAQAIKLDEGSLVTLKVVYE